MGKWERMETYPKQEYKSACEINHFDRSDFLFSIHSLLLLQNSIVLMTTHKRGENLLKCTTKDENGLIFIVHFFPLIF
jgi:hypothetical protein